MPWLRAALRCDARGARNGSPEPAPGALSTADGAGPREGIGMLSPFSTLRQFVREKAPVERCEMCSLVLGPEHHHWIEPATRKLVCACGACALLFSGQASARYRQIP